MFIGGLLKGYMVLSMQLMLNARYFNSVCIKGTSKMWQDRRNQQRMTT